MDTIIDTRQFPKEMEEKPKTPPRGGEGKSSFFLWFLLFIVLLFGMYFLYMKFFQGGNVSHHEVHSVEKENEFIRKVVTEKESVPSATHRRDISHLFGE